MSSDPVRSESISKTRIALLPEHVRNQIAAGEVIERPASVVKELIENALDAGARRIVIDLEEGGARLVRVQDDGSGMPREDLELAFAAHATSKLRESGDLEHIASLGFRGEALASIGSVARARITSRERGSERAWRIDDDGGRLMPVEECGAVEGTTVEVRELFFNLPARRRFLKQPGTELARSLDVIQRLALAHPGVAFVATHDGRRAFDVEAPMDLLARIRRAFGAELAAALVAVQASAGGMTLTGFVAPPRFARADTGRQMWFLNGRFLKDKVLLRALKEGYRGFLFDSRQPVAFLHLALDPARVDVNVHPAKAEVRFRDERLLFGFVVNAVREAVKHTDMATPGARLVDSALRREEPLPFVPVSAVHERPAAIVTPRISSAPIARPVAEAVPRGPVLQVARTYLVRPTLDGFEVVDQHALHERITFEMLAAEMRAGSLEVQRLLVPELIELAPSEVELVLARAAELAEIGIELAPFGERTLALHGLPARLERPDAGAIVREIVDLLQAERAPTRERLLEEVLHRAACRSSVMAGDELEPEEIAALFARGAALESDQTCVHGRPTRIRFTLADLERAFLRR